MKKTRELETTEEIDIPFIDKEGKTVNVRDVISKSDIAFLERAGAWIFTHNAILKMAKMAGIKPPHNTSFVLDFDPELKNMQSHEVRGILVCEAVGTIEGKCIHGSDAVFTSTGEASRTNTGARGGTYLRTMAEKRSYDRGVLQHLEIASSKVYSEEEAEAFTMDKTPVTTVPSPQDLEAMAESINLIINSKNADELGTARETIREHVTSKNYNDNQREYLNQLYKKQLGVISGGI